jgi:cysteinyl-tRNA synthetase
VFRIYDTRTGQVEEIDPGPGSLLRLYAPGPAPDRPAPVGDLRSLLVADLIRRNAEHRHGLTVAACVVIPDAGNDDGTADDGILAADATALNIRPAEQVARAPELAGLVTGAASPGEIIIDAQPGPSAGPVTVWHSVRAGAVTFTGREAGGGAPGLDLSGLADRGLDPLAARLALMSRRYAEQANLTWDVLGDADQALRRWRELVAEWAESPSRPMCAELTAQVAAAFDGDLDTPAALQALRGLEQDPQIHPGSKFESFLHADQLLALDLPREIGRPRRG